MYDLVASHGNDAGLPIKKPWRVAYLNSSLVDFLNRKCDGSHDHSSCSGQNVSGTECYTPLIATAVHQCFRRDAKLNGMDRSDNANLIMPTAISVLKLRESNEHNHWVDLLMAGQPPRPDEGGWPLPREVSKAPPQAKGWRKQKLRVAGRQEGPEQKLDKHEQKLGEVDFPLGG